MQSFPWIITLLSTLVPYSQAYSAPSNPILPAVDLDINLIRKYVNSNLSYNVPLSDGGGIFEAGIGTFKVHAHDSTTLRVTFIIDYMVETGSVFCCGTNCPKHNSAAVSEATAFLSLQLDSLQGSYRIKAEPGGIISKDDCDDGAGILRLPSAEITKIINEILTSRLGEACRRLEQEANKSLQEIPPFARIRFKGN